LGSRGKILDQKRGLSLPVDLIRTLGIVLIIGLHAANEAHPIVTQVGSSEIWRWWTVNVYDSLTRVGVPLFVMLSGSLLLLPSKIEPLRVYFKKRWNRIGLPILFWGGIYFAWSYFSNHQTLTGSFILQGILTGPYYHFWYLYMLIGLYLIAPIFRLVVAYGNRVFLKYVVFIWFLGPLLIPLPGLLGSFHVDSNILTIPWWAGYFLLGAFLRTATVRRSILAGLLSLGLVATIIGTYVVTLVVGGRLSLFFQDYFSPTIILASVALFTLLISIQVPSDRTQHRHPKASWLVSQISQNTLPIYLLHVIILESLQKGYLGIKISLNIFNPAFEIPLITIITLFICLALIIPAKKIPFFKKIVG
jgi:surface polysaccharide O-acyltransferase-like enzyme